MSKDDPLNRNFKLFKWNQFIGLKSNINVVLSISNIPFASHSSVSTLKEQLEEMRKISQNSQASNDKIVQLQNQVCSLLTFTSWRAGSVMHQHCFFWLVL